MKSVKGLLVDSDIAFMRALEIGLHNNNFRLNTADKANRAKRLIKKEENKHNLDVLFCDIRLDDFKESKSGLSVISSFKHWNPQGIIIGMSSDYSNSDMILESCDGFYEKSFDSPKEDIDKLTQLYKKLLFQNKPKLNYDNQNIRLTGTYNYNYY